MYTIDWYWADVHRRVMATTRVPAEYLAKMPTVAHWVARRLDETLHGEIAALMQTGGWPSVVTSRGTIQEQPRSESLFHPFGQPMIEYWQGATIWPRITEPVDAEMMPDVMREKNTRIVQVGIRTYDLRPVANLAGAYGLGCVINGRCRVWCYQGDATYAD
jgi:hypothetical protein